MVGNLRIEWVNHAGFILRGEDTVILCDPWLTGPVFNNGWEQLVPTDLTLHDFSNVTHIWFSHEHPDHFHPPSLKKLMPLLDKGVKVLFQKTLDKRLVDYFSRQGVPVEEIPSGEKRSISPTAHVTIGKNGIEDSWALFEIGGVRILNLNDCLFSRRAEITALAKQLGKVDVLLSHFSYAEKIGNNEDTALRERTAQYYMELVVDEAKAFSAKYIIPFASFKFFSHKENFYLNSGAATARRMHDTILGKADGATVILYPGDVWNYGDKVDCEVAIEKYAACERRISPVNYAEATHTPEDLTALSREFNVRIAKPNGGSLLFKAVCAGLPKLRVWLTDLNIAGVISVDRAFAPSKATREKCDLETSSTNIAYLYQHLYGANSLMVNGRYQASKLGNFKLFVVSHLCLMASANVGLTFSYVAKNALKIAMNIVYRMRG